MHDTNDRQWIDCRKQNVLPTTTAALFDSNAAPKVHLLTLPLEIRRDIFGSLLQATTGTSFPPLEQADTLEAIKSWLCGPEEVAQWRRNRPKRNVYVDLPLICRQIYHEIRSLPFEINAVRLRAPYGSNVSATMQFFRQLTSAQLGAIRSLELELVASPTESWQLGSILKTVSNVRQELKCRGRPNFAPSEQQGLRILKLRIRTDDLLTPCSASNSGLKYLLAIEQPAAGSRGSSLATSHPSWMADGLSHLEALEWLEIEINMSSVAASRMTPSHKSSFEERARGIIPQMCSFQVRWIRQHDVGIGFGSHEWTDSFWLNSCMPGQVKV